MKGGRLLAVGVNKTAAPKRFTKSRPGMHLHSEINALTNLDRNKTKGATLYVNGYTTAGNEMTTKPCKECTNFIEVMGIKRIVYVDKGQVKEIK